MRARARACSPRLSCSWSGARRYARAVEPDEILSDPILESRARDVSAGLRCLVCQNQSIDDSAAPLAKDLRVIVRERLQAGDTDDQIRAFLVQRYGDFVLLKPPFEASTLLLVGHALPGRRLGGAALLLRKRDEEVSQTADAGRAGEARRPDGRRRALIAGLASSAERTR